MVTLQMLLMSGADVNAVGDVRYRPLHYASESGAVEVIKVAKNASCLYTLAELPKRGIFSFGQR